MYAEAYYTVFMVAVYGTVCMLGGYGKYGVEYGTVCMVERYGGFGSLLTTTTDIVPHSSHSPNDQSKIYFE